MFVEKTSLVELKVSQGTSTKNVFLQTTLLDDGKSGFRLVLTDGEDVWEGQVLEDDLDKLSCRLKMDFDKFVSQTASAFTREGLQEITFEYHLKALPSDRVQFVWKKCVSSDSIKYQLGQVSLEKQDAPVQSLRGLMSQCVVAISSLKKQIGNLEADNERLARDRNSAIKRLDKCVAAKAEVEADLFSKFVAILNCKKEKIRELEEDRHDEAPSVMPHSPADSTLRTDTVSKKAPDVTTRCGQPSSSHIDKSTSHTMDTDEEEEEVTPKRMRVDPKTGSSLENSINLGEEEEESSAAPVARRARRRAPPKKPSISKPILPKVTPASLDRPSSARKSSLRKSGSGSSKGSVNTEDLLDQM